MQTFASLIVGIIYTLWIVHLLLNNRLIWISMPTWRKEHVWQVYSGKVFFRTRHRAAILGYQPFIKVGLRHYGNIHNALTSERATLSSLLIQSAVTVASLSKEQEAASFDVYQHSSAYEYLQKVTDVSLLSPYRKGYIHGIILARSLCEPNRASSPSA